MEDNNLNSVTNKSLLCIFCDTKKKIRGEKYAFYIVPWYRETSIFLHILISVNTIGFKNKIYILGYKTSLVYTSTRHKEFKHKSEFLKKHDILFKVLISYSISWKCFLLDASSSSLRYFQKIIQMGWRHCVMGNRF